MATQKAEPVVAPVVRCSGHWAENSMIVGHDAEVTFERRFRCDIPTGHEGAHAHVLSRDSEGNPIATLTWKAAP